jgi:hypothetical protein
MGRPLVFIVRGPPPDVKKRREENRGQAVENVFSTACPSFQNPWEVLKTY